ncbi:HPr-like protein Crh [Planctomycetes bacterium Pan216]|uniref:HPr-like protein Crh n=1 Tax=Kolteria novifilia TaxID=2527975 RepID=A0A518B9J6_9BACT|nr:HPr-like protein Crh [Planctomycetes bacterium Pan216]
MAANVNGDAQGPTPVRVDANHYRSQVVIVNSMGLHARPASLFVERANCFESNVTIQKGSDEVDGKSILQLLSLSAEEGTALVLETRGPDAEAASISLSQLVASGFDEMDGDSVAPSSP